MSHYGYADARPLLDEFNYEYHLYTAQNIDELANDLKQLKYDAVVFTTNAFNDKTVRNEVQSESFTNAFSEFLNQGKGCLILHQLRLAQEGLQGSDKSNLLFLPQKLNAIQPIARDRNETSIEGDLNPTAIIKEHPIFLYPHDIVISQIKNQCLSFPSLKGLYWHYWERVDNSEWDILLYDIGSDGIQRPLLVSSKKSEKFRIVLSSLTLDWQKQKHLLQNILVYIVEGHHYTALLRDNKRTSVAFDYFVELLRSQKYPFRLYDIDQDTSHLKRNLKNEIHTIIILGPFVDKDRLDEELYSEIKHLSLEGKIKLIGIDQSDKTLKKFYVAGRERFALRLLYDVEMNIQKELKEGKEGYIDGSFWSTAESLQTLYQIKNLKSKYDIKTVEKALNAANVHDRGGSYDEVFGVSCALLWLRATYLGSDSKSTQSTLSWVRKYLNDYEDREKALAYTTLISISCTRSQEIEQLKKLLSNQIQSVDRLSEIDLIVYLKAAIAIDMKDIIGDILARLEKIQKDGGWVDLATTATATIALVDSLKLTKNFPSQYGKMKSSIEMMIFKSIIYIQNLCDREKLEARTIIYPWDNKASTSLKCIQAWLKFEELIDLPVLEIIDSVKSYSHIDNEIKSSKTSLVVLEDLKDENRKVLAENADLKKNIAELKKKKEKKTLLRNAVLWLGLSIVIYILTSIVIYSFLTGHTKSLPDLVKGAFIDYSGLHYAIILIVLAIVAAYFPLINWWKKRQTGDTK